MADKKQLLLQTQKLNSSASKAIISLLLFALLLIMLSLVGCQKDQNKVDESFTSPSEQKKAELLNDIDRKFEDLSVPGRSGKSRRRIHYSGQF
ncbi:MAG: hypothetical protein ACYST2_02840 [Planctomycetota bacterium]